MAFILRFVLISIITRISCVEARCVCRQAAVRLPNFYPLLDSPDLSKTQSTVGTALICTVPPPAGTEYTEEISDTVCRKPQTTQQSRRRGY